MESKPSLITVSGRNCINLFAFKIKGKNYLQGLDAGPSLLCRFLNDMNQACQCKIIDHRSLLELSAVDCKYNGEYEVHYQESIDTIHDSKAITFDISTSYSKYEMPPDMEISSPLLVIHDPEGDFLSGTPKMRWQYVADSDPSIIFYQTSSLITHQSRVNPDVIKIIERDRVEKFIIITDVRALSKSGTRISLKSWEKAAADTMRNFTPREFLKETSHKGRAKIEWIIRFGYVGAINLQTSSGLDNGQRSHLYFDPKSEGPSVIQTDPARLRVLETAFLGGMTSSVMVQIDRNKPPEWKSAIKNGISAARYVDNEGIFDFSTGLLHYPILQFRESLTLEESVIPATELDGWSILTSTVNMNGKHERKDEKYMLDLCAKIVNEGIEKALSYVPIAKFGDLTTADRWEIENFNTVSNLLEDYFKQSQKEPLSIGVFGEIGAGKLSAVNGIIQKTTKNITQKDSDRFPILKYNLSQFLDYSNLMIAFQTIRDRSVLGQIPIVYFDEFDTNLNGELGWLKYFLHPMQDGQFFEYGSSRPIGKAVFIFICSTAHTFKSFRDDRIETIPTGKVQPSVDSLDLLTPEPSLSQPESYSSVNYNLIIRKEMAGRAAKKPNFVKGLHLCLDVRGYDKPLDDDLIYIVRRAILLRSKLEESSIRSVDLSVIYGLLKITSYKDGARSMDHIIKGSTPEEGHLDRKSLPSLDPYLNVYEFERLFDYANALGELNDQISRYESQTLMKHAEKRELPKQIIYEKDPRYAEEGLKEFLEMLECIDNTWDVRFFADLSGFCNLPDAYGSVLTVTESAEGAFANTAACYISWRWGEQATRTLNWLSEVLSVPRSSRPVMPLSLFIPGGGDGDSSPCIELQGQLHDEPNSQLKQSTVAVRVRLVKGTVEEYYTLLADVASQLAWSVAAFKEPASKSLSFTRATFDYILDKSSKQGAAPCLDVCIASKNISSHGQDNEGACWKRIFTGMNVAVGFTIPPRPQQMFGVEVPFAVMTTFAEVNYPVAYKKGYVLKGWQNALFPVRAISMGLPGSAVQWHIFCSKRHRLYMEEVKGVKGVKGQERELAPIECKQSQIGFLQEVEQTKRHFLGLYGSSTIRIGTNQSQEDEISSVRVTDRIEETSLLPRVKWLRNIGFALGGGVFVSGSISTGLGFPETMEREMRWRVERINHDLIDAARANSTILYDVSSRVAWMLPQICVVMRLVQAWTKAKWPHIQVEYPTVSDMISDRLEDVLDRCFSAQPRIPLMEKFYYFVRLLGRLEDERDLKPAKRLHPSRLAGVDFTTLLHTSNRFSILNTNISIESGGDWLQMLKSNWKDHTTPNRPYRVVTLFCSSLNPQPILPNTDVCDTWMPPPIDQDYFITAMYCLRQLSDELGIGPVRLSREHVWERGDLYPYQRCAGRSCNRLQTIVRHHPGNDRQDREISRLIQNAPAEAAVVFGQKFPVNPQRHCIKKNVLAQQNNAAVQQSNVPAQQPNALAQQPNVPAQQPNVPAQQPNVPAQQPNVPAQQPNAPAQQPNVPAQQQNVLGKRRPGTMV